MNNKENNSQYLYVQIDKFHLALPITQIIEVIIPDNGAEIRKQAGSQQSVFKYNDGQIPLVDLYCVLNNIPDNKPADCRIIITEWAGHRAAVIVDKAEEILRPETEMTAGTGYEIPGLSSEFLTGKIIVDDREISILALDKTINAVPARQ